MEAFNPIGEALPPRVRPALRSASGGRKNFGQFYNYRRVGACQWTKLNHGLVDDIVDKAKSPLLVRSGGHGGRRSPRWWLCYTRFWAMP